MKDKLTRYVLTDEIYKLVKQQILSHELSSGDHINIDQLARSLQVSNIPIREALSRLASDGFVETIPFKGIFVSHISRQELLNMFEVRQLLEPYAAERATLTIPDSELLDVEDRLARISQQKLTSAGEFIDWIEAINNSVHGLILKYCGNDSLAATVHEYISRIQRYLNYITIYTHADFGHLEWQEHHHIYEALRARDAQQAAQAMTTHLRNACQRTSAFFD